MKHIWTIALTVVGSAVLVLPAYVRPWLAPSQQALFDHYVTLSPAAYWWLSIAVLVGGFLLACFFVSEEDRLEIQVERKAKEELAAKLAGPILAGDVLSGTHWGPRSLNSQEGTRVGFHVAVRNVGLVASIVKDWHFFVPSRDLEELPTTIFESPDEPLGPPKHVQEHKAIQPGDAGEFALVFWVPIPVDKLKGLQCELRFLDVLNTSHSIPFSMF